MIFQVFLVFFLSLVSHMYSDKAVLFVYPLLLNQGGGVSPTIPTFVGPKILLFMVKACIFRVLVGPIIVRLRLFSNGRTNFALLLNDSLCM